jgi:hypothetical protein
MDFGWKNGPKWGRNAGRSRENRGKMMENWWDLTGIAKTSRL